MMFKGKHQWKELTTYETVLILVTNYQVEQIIQLITNHQVATNLYEQMSPHGMTTILLQWVDVKKPRLTNKILLM